MQFAALVEYLITGIVASIWVTAIVNHIVPLPSDFIASYKEMFIVVYFPIAYVLGIYVDVISSFFIRRAKEIYIKLLEFKCIRCVDLFFSCLSELVFGSPKKTPYKNAVKILVHSPSDMVKSMDTYVSRDRIARGMALNFFIGGLVSFWVLPCDIKDNVSAICFGVFLMSIFVWRRLRRLSSTFKKVAVERLESDNKA